MYADDHQIYKIGKEMFTVVSQLQQSATLATNSGMIRISFRATFRSIRWLLFEEKTQVMSSNEYNC